MKNLGKTAIVCAIIFFVFVIAGGICFGIGIATSTIGSEILSDIPGIIDSTNDLLYIDSEDSDSSPLTLSQHYTLSDKIKEIELDNICGDITIIAVSGTDVITADYNGPASLLNNDKIDFKESNDTLKINFGKKNGATINFGGISIGNQIGKFTVYIPMSYMGSFEISNAAGAVEISDFTLNELEIKNVAGEINIAEIVINELSLNNTVGEANIFGEIGAIDISDNLGEINIENTIPFNRECEIENGLGEVNISLPSHARINLESSNVLGEVSVDSSLQSANGVSFEISSCLGEVEITAK